MAVVCPLLSAVDVADPEHSSTASEVEALAKEVLEGHAGVVAVGG